MKESPSTPLWISHRGYKESADENTIEAFCAAKAQGFRAIETDLRVTKDGHIILCHDRSLLRIANADLRIRDAAHAELRRVKLPQGGIVPSLDDLIDASSRELENILWTFDVKRETGAEVVAQIVARARNREFASWLHEQTRFLFWDQKHEASLTASLPEIECYAQKPECWRSGLSVLVGLPSLGGIRPGRVYGIPERLGPRFLFRSAMTRPYRMRGAKTVAFLPSSPKAARAATRAGFDEILTDGLIENDSQ